MGILSKWIFCQIFVWQLVAFVIGNNLQVNTFSGPIVGVSKKTFLNKVPYISYKGIPYAQPPIGKLRFKVPQAVKPWKNPIITTNQHQKSCVATRPSLYHLKSSQSEDCLYLNIYTPVMDKVKRNKKLAVLIYIHGGAFNEGDGTDAYYSPDFIMEENAIFVTLGYRLGPFGFTNFDLPDYTGNMGLKDQREALKWIKKNIQFFGGDPNSITVSGESAGAASAHLHVLSDSCNYMNRAIMWSGTAFNYWAHYKKNNHLELLKETFKHELGNRTSKQDILDFMINIPARLIAEKMPVINFPDGLIELFWGPVIEDKTKAFQPFLTQRPHEIYAKNKFTAHCKSVQVVFGVTSAEFMFFLDPTNPYAWVESVNNNAIIGLPYHGLNLTKDDDKYKATQAKIKKFYFGKDKIEATPKGLNQFVQMNSDYEFVLPSYEAMRLHSKVSTTFCHHSDISLHTNIVKIPRHLGMVDGMGHIEDIAYIFKANDFDYLYKQALKKQNGKTVDAWKFVTKLFIDFAKSGSLEYSSPVKNVNNAQCVHLTNDGLRSIVRPRKEAMKLWDEIKKGLEPYIIDEY